MATPVVNNNYFRLKTEEISYLTHWVWLCCKSLWFMFKQAEAELGQAQLSWGSSMKGCSWLINGLDGSGTISNLLWGLKVYLKYISNLLIYNWKLFLAVHWVKIKRIHERCIGAKTVLGPIQKGQENVFSKLCSIFNSMVGWPN